MEFKKGQRVIATRRITTGRGSVWGNMEAAKPFIGDIVAEPGDVGVVLYVDPNKPPAVFFEKSGLMSSYIDPESDIHPVDEDDCTNPDTCGVCHVCQHQKQHCSCETTVEKGYIQTLESYLLDLLDGVKGPHEIFEQTGMLAERCEEIFNWYTDHRS